MKEVQALAALGSKINYNLLIFSYISYMVITSVTCLSRVP